MAMVICGGQPRLRKHDQGAAWAVLFLCFYCGCITIGFSYASGIYRQPWLSEFNTTSISLVSGVGSAQVGMTFLASPFAGILYNTTFGPRANLFLGAILTVVGYLTASLVTHIVLLYVTYSFTVGMGMCCLYFIMGALPKLWFKKWLVFSMGVACAGTGWSTMVTVPALSYVIKIVGWRNCLRVQAAFTGVLVFAAILLPDSPSEERTKSQEDVVDETFISKPLAKTSLLKTLLTAKYFCYFISCVGYTFGVVTFVLCYMDLCRLELGDSTPNVFIGLSIANGCSRIISGATANLGGYHPGWNYTAGLLLTGVTVTFTPYLVSAMNSFVLATLFGSFLGFFIGAVFSTPAKFFKTTNFASLLGISLMAQGAANMASGPLTGYLLDGAAIEAARLSDDQPKLLGEYRLAFYTLGLIGIAAGVFAGVAVLLDLREKGEGCWHRPNSTALDEKGIPSTNGREIPLINDKEMLLTNDREITLTNDK